jgi:hypothetical protein
MPGTTITGIGNEAKNTEQVTRFAMFLRHRMNATGTTTTNASSHATYRPGAL